MAVFTMLPAAELAEWLKAFDTGALLDVQGIGHGMENSNYFVSCVDPQQADGTRQYVLTVLEELSAQQAQFHIQLLETLAAHDIPVPCIIRDNNGQALHTLHGKPALLCTRLSGQHVETPTLNQCARIGSLLAELHLAASAIREDYHGTRDDRWLERCVYQASPLLSEAEKNQVSTVLNNYLSLQHHQLPHGIIHGDLFRDNAFFDGDQLTGVIDFYSAGVGFLLFDIAVLVNDWCRNSDNHIDLPRYNALLNAYTSQRPWTAQEHLCWPLMLQTAAMRFWLSRLLAGHGRSEESLFIGKDPAEFKALFDWHLNSIDHCL